MKRKDYQEPTMEVVRAEADSVILAGSEKVYATMDDVFEEETWTAEP